MIDLTNPEQVRHLQSSFRVTFDSPNGKEVIAFLEERAGWYDFSATDPNIILIQHGRRQILATIKTFLELNPDQIVAIANKEI